MKGYLANGLFSLGDRMLNDKISFEARSEIKGIDLYVPQENNEINDKNSYADSEMIASADYNRLVQSDFIIAVIDGVEIDSGVSAEIGIAYSMGIPIYALFTDNRQFGTGNLKKIDALMIDPIENQFIYRNLFVIGLIKKSGGSISININDLIKSVKWGEN